MPTDLYIPRCTKWNILADGIQIREWRPRIRRPLDCPFNSYDVVYRPMKYEYEGACENFDLTRMDCIFCAACLMSNAHMEIPFDVRDRCDDIMGW